MNPFQEVFLNESCAEKKLNEILISIHNNGPINGEDLQYLAIIKNRFPSLFEKYENEILLIGPLL